jgi:hypothetical protein
MGEKAMERGDRRRVRTQPGFELGIEHLGVDGFVATGAESNKLYRILFMRLMLSVRTHLAASVELSGGACQDFCVRGALQVRVDAFGVVQNEGSECFVSIRWCGLLRRGD